ncbi:hypothetical protein BHM03_00054785 [Ensete ventricosum]|nr:hypothetical protein BHM03_00054785 [Ensete ventricosum]
MLHGIKSLLVAGRELDLSSIAARELTELVEDYYSGVGLVEHCCSRTELSWPSTAARELDYLSIKLGVVAEDSTRLGSSRVRKRIHVGREWGVTLSSDLCLKNLHLGLGTRVSLPRVRDEEPARRSRRGGGARHDPSDDQVSGAPAWPRWSMRLSGCHLSVKTDRLPAWSG